MIAEVGIAQAGGSLLHPGDTAALRGWLGEMAAAGELALVDAVPTQAPRPGRSWAAHKPMYDSKHGMHAVNTHTLTTECGDLLAVHGGWPGSLHEVTQLRHSHFARPLLASKVRVVTVPREREVPPAGYRAARADFNVLARRGTLKNPAPGDRQIAPARARAQNERPHDLLTAWRVMERTRIRPCAEIHNIAQAVAVLVGLRTDGHRVSNWPATT